MRRVKNLIKPADGLARIIETESCGSAAGVDSEINQTAAPGPDDGVVVAADVGPAGNFSRGVDA